ncbi:MAG: GDSL-type esterase/lipase family protein [Aquihabitans sp.]
MGPRNRVRSARRDAGLLVGLIFAAVVLPACGSDHDPGNYVSIGDSYGQGLQPKSDGVTPDYTNGFAYLVPDKAEQLGWDLQLENFACGGATVESMTDDPGCGDIGLSPGGPRYDVPQLAAAIDFLKEHPDHVELITVVIGINDVIPCVWEADDQTACVADAVASLKPHLADALEDLRAAAGPDTLIVGLSYPNVILGSYVGDEGPDLAAASVAVFKDVINPMLKESYEAVDGIFVDVTAGTGAYTPFTETTTFAPYGEIPVAVAEVCQLTWFCKGGDVHPTDQGHEAIADLIVEALPAPPDPRADQAGQTE